MQSSGRGLSVLCQGRPLARSLAGETVKRGSREGVPGARLAGDVSRGCAPLRTLASGASHGTPSADSRSIII